MMYVTTGAGGNAKPASEFLWDRISRIVPIYWIYTLCRLHFYCDRRTSLKSTKVDARYDFYVSLIYSCSRETMVYFILFL